MMTCLLRRFFLSFAVLAALAAPALAQSFPGADTQQAQPPTPKMLNDYSARGAQIRYLGRFQTLDGWLVIRNGNPEFYYSTQDGSAMVMGILFDPNTSQMLTNEQLARLQMNDRSDAATLTRMVLEGEQKTGASAAATAPQPGAPIPPTPAPATADPNKTPSLSDRLYMDMVAANSVTVGQGTGKDIYIFLDPNCPHCQGFLQDMEKAGYMGPNGPTLHAVLVGFDAKSLVQAAYLLATPNPGDLLLRYAKGETTAIPAPNSITTTGIEKNVQMMTNWNFQGTPIIIYRDTMDKVKIVRGRPSDVQTLVKDLGAK